MSTPYTPQATQALLDTLRAMKRELGDSQDPRMRKLMDEAGELIDAEDAEKWREDS